MIFFLPFLDLPRWILFSINSITEQAQLEKTALRTLLCCKLEVPKSQIRTLKN